MCAQVLAREGHVGFGRSTDLSSLGTASCHAYRRESVCHAMQTDIIPFVLHACSWGMFSGSKYSYTSVMWNAQHVGSCPMALPKALRLLLMCFASSKRSPVASLLPTLSLPVQCIAFCIAGSWPLSCSRVRCMQEAIRTYAALCLGSDMTLRYKTKAWGCSWR